MINKKIVLMGILAWMPALVFAALDQMASFPVQLMIEDFGTYKLLKKTDRDFTADSTAGYSSVISTRHLEKTDTIKMKQGVVFGFNFAIQDTSREDQWVPIVIQIKHPPTTNYLGKRSVGFSQNSAARLKADGRYHNGAFYIFSEPYEMVPGEWHISVIYRDEMVLTQRFEVVE